MTSFMTSQLKKTGLLGLGLFFSCNSYAQNFKSTQTISNQVIHAFDGGTGGSGSLSTLVEGSDGFLYGTSFMGGEFLVYGTVFRVSADGKKFEIVHSFSGGEDGAFPMGKLVKGMDGALYGTTMGGPADPSDINYGTIFKLSPQENKYEVLYRFHEFDDGRNPQFGLIMGPDGILYGTAMSGRTSAKPDTMRLTDKVVENGTLFSINSDGTNYRTIRIFEGGSTDGSFPNGLTFGTDGFLYGTTQWGGDDNCWAGCGTLYKIKPDGSDYKVIHFFRPASTTPKAMFPLNLTQGTDGVLYGTTGLCIAGCNTQTMASVYKISTDGSSYRTLHFFNKNEQLASTAELVQFPGTNVMFGTTQRQFGNPNSKGTIFRIAQDGTDYTVVHSFKGQKDGEVPMSSVVFRPDGFLYGTTTDGGINKAGTVFKISF